jgi:chromosomal replication initiation ATPase DnaA
VGPDLALVKGGEFLAAGEALLDLPPDPATARMFCANSPSRRTAALATAAAPTVALKGQVIFMCGPAGSGKSAVARQYEQQGLAAYPRNYLMTFARLIQELVRNDYRSLLRQLGAAGR